MGGVDGYLSFIKFSIMKIHMQHSQDLEKITLCGLIIFHYLIHFSFYHYLIIFFQVSLQVCSCLSINNTLNHFVFFPLTLINKKLS